jgi:hypothetical protein
MLTFETKNKAPKTLVQKKIRFDEILDFKFMKKYLFIQNILLWKTLFKQMKFDNGKKNY